MFGDLEHSRWELVQHGIDPWIEQRAGGEVHEEPHVAGRGAPLADGLEAGQLEFGADAQVRRVFEPLVRSAAARE
jgi:hypothetical protein